MSYLWHFVTGCVILVMSSCHGQDLTGYDVSVYVKLSWQRQRHLCLIVTIPTILLRKFKLMFQLLILTSITNNWLLWFWFDYSNSASLNEERKISRQWWINCWVLYSFLGANQTTIALYVLIQKKWQPQWNKVLSPLQGIISLVPKPGKDTLLIDNWRPITLLTIDYKILAMVFANRLKVKLNQFVAETQSGFYKR